MSERATKTFKRKRTVAIFTHGWKRSNGPGQARRRGRDQQRSAASRRVAERGDARKATNRGWPQRVQDAQGDRRARLRTDQGAARFSPLRLAWQRECQPRVEAGVRGQQPAEAVPGRRGSGNGIKRREKGPVLPKTAQKACYKLPTGLLPARPRSNTSPANR